ncbi:Sulfotransferase [Rhodopirellula maiorica SM1]|uniref:Sulfotransferase n=1 Tax=Rhodopirellula maiorica SM1 TaxID=1265738 RepID=M5RPT4_9BACT|nr:sulfotransferase domain-containing protein [Rhodopirellula maiorica]EMI17392.1 Sulfotransferase [Rhodopirellula maiorica SM1]
MRTSQQHQLGQNQSGQNHLPTAQPPLPNCFIIGAPKCGTTSLYEFLCMHPEVCFSHPKEPLFWATDFPGANSLSIRPVKTQQEYLGLFKSKDLRSKRIIAEASTCYLMSETAVGNILNFNPAAKFIAMLRNPVELVQAWHNELVYNGLEPETDFHTAWMLQQSRQNGQCLPKVCPVPEFLQYGRVGRLGEQIQRVKQLVPSDQLLLIHSRNLRNDAEHECRRVLEFLGLSAPDRLEFPTANASKRMRFRFLATLFFHPPAILEKPTKWLRRGFGAFPKPLRAIIDQAIRPRNKKSNLEPSFSSELNAYFAEDLRLLNEIAEHDFR